MLRPREGHVERIEFLDAPLQAFLVVVLAVGRVQELGFRAVDGQCPQRVEGSLGRFAPEHLVEAYVLHLAVAVRHEDRVVLQALALVYGHDVDTVNLAGRDVLHAHVRLPEVQEGRDVARPVAQVVLQFVIEGHEVGILPPDAVHAQDAVEFLAEFVQRVLPQFLPACQEFLGQHLLQRRGCILFHADRPRLFQGKVLLHEVVRRHGVLLAVAEYAQGSQQHVEGAASGQFETLVADHLDPQRLPYMVYEFLDVRAGTQQDAHLVVGETFLVQLADFLAEVVEHHAVPFLHLARLEHHLHMAFGRFSLRPLLCHVAVDVLDDTLLILSIQQLCGNAEERVVEGYDVHVGTEIREERPGVFLLQAHLPVDVLQDVPVPVAEAVDALLDVPHEQVGTARREALQQEHLEVFPLQFRGVLELVNHDVAEERAHPFEDEGSIASLYEPVE